MRNPVLAFREWYYHGRIPAGDYQSKHSEKCLILVSERGNAVRRYNGNIIFNSASGQLITWSTSGNDRSVIIPAGTSQRWIGKRRLVYVDDGRIVSPGFIPTDRSIEISDDLVASLVQQAFARNMMSSLSGKGVNTKMILIIGVVVLVGAGLWFSGVLSPEAIPVDPAPVEINAPGGVPNG